MPATITHMEEQKQQESEAREYGSYRKLGQPADTVSGATQELFEVRTGNADSSGGISTAFKVIAALGIILLVVAIVVTQGQAL